MPKNIFFNTSSGCSSFHIAINSSLSLFLFNFADILTLRNIQLSFEVLLFFSVMFPLLTYIFQKACSNLAGECENNSKNLDKSWTRPTFLQLNGSCENYQVSKNTLSKFYIPFNWIRFHLTGWIVHFTLETHPQNILYSLFCLICDNSIPDEHEEKAAWTDIAYWNNT